jgi:hypothetical protein
VASKSLVKQLKMLWENWGACVWGVVCCLLFVVSCCALSSLVSSCVVPYGGGVHLPFIGQGEGELQACHTIQLHGEVWCATP